MDVARFMDLLGEGYGVEDIALIMSVPVEDCRYQVRRMRANGDLAKVLAA